MSTVCNQKFGLLAAACAAVMLAGAGTAMADTVVPSISTTPAPTGNQIILVYWFSLKWNISPGA